VAEDGLKKGGLTIERITEIAIDTFNISSLTKHLLLLKEERLHKDEKAVTIFCNYLRKPLVLSYSYN
jgi:hypothetical protein